MKIAALQLSSQGDIDANLRMIAGLIDEAVAGGAQLVLLPEAFAFMGLDDDRAKVAETLGEGGKIQDALSQWSAESGVYLIAGGLAEASSHKARPFNTSVVYSPQGQIIARYRKIHLFDVELEGGGSYHESKTTSPGLEPQVFEAGEWKVGLSICYDLRFAEMYAWQRREGAQLLTVPSAFTQTTGAAHWQVLLRARAIENQCWVLAAGQQGSHPGGRRTYGHSMIIDPWGRVVAELVETGPGVLLADIDLELVHAIRRKMPVADHRR